MFGMDAADPARIRQAAKSKDVFLRTVGMRVSLSGFFRESDGGIQRCCV